MWSALSVFIMRNRVSLLLALLGATLFMAFFAKDVTLDYEMPRIIPPDHPEQVAFEAFKEKFGEDGRVLMVGLQTDKLFDLNFFNAFYDLGKQLQTTKGVEAVLSVPLAATIAKDTSAKKFVIEPLATSAIGSQEALDSIKKVFYDLPFYKNLLYNPETGATILGITISKEVLDSKGRISVVSGLIDVVNTFAQAQQTTVHYSGLPYLRMVRITQMQSEIRLTLLLAVLITAFLLLLLFRSLKAMLVPMLVVLIGIIWMAGISVLLGYKITLLTALIPPLIVVIGVPNCVYLINQYHRNLRQGYDKMLALQKSVEKISYTVFFANLTTAIGFSVFAFMSSQLLHEFGIVAGLSILVLFVTSLIVIPAFFSFFAQPAPKHLTHLDSTWAKGFLDKLTWWTSQHPKAIQGASVLVLIVAASGLLQLKARGYIFDDLPKDSQEYADLKFFEQHFNGVLPLEILIDTKKPKGVTRSKTLKRINKVQKIFAADSLFSKPLSLVEGLKFVTQAFYNNKANFYALPGSRESTFIFKYLSNMNQPDSLGTADDKVANDRAKRASSELLNQFSDSTQQIARLSVSMADVGSHKFRAVLDSVQAKVATVMDTSKYNIQYTGTSLISYLGYEHLVSGLVSSVLFAFLLIAIVVAYIFRSPKMLTIALIPNLIPLMVTGAIMGYSDIFLKPSTVLIFSVAFGISVDFTIHFLAKYRQEMAATSNDVQKSVNLAMQETGLSMLYTSIILFVGFSLFTLSTFEGTFYLGILTSITIIVAIIANLILLPSILFKLAEK